MEEHLGANRIAVNMTADHSFQEIRNSCCWMTGGYWITFQAHISYKSIQIPIKQSVLGKVATPHVCSGGLKRSEQQQLKKSRMGLVWAM